MRRSRTGACVVMALTVLLSGCAYIYNYRVAELWLRWYVGDYVRWDRAQEQLFRERLREQLQWHRDTQLRRYRDWLVAVRSDMAGTVDIDLLERRGRELRGFWHDMMEQLEPDFIHFLSDLSPGQVQDLIANFRDEQAERSDKALDQTSVQIRRERVTAMVKNIQRWTGRLNSEQRARVERWAASLPDSRSSWLASRARWIDALEQAMAERNNAEAFRGQVRRLFVTPEELWDPAYRQLLEGNTRLTLELLVDIHNSLSPRQRGALDRHVEKWIHTLEDLERGRRSRSG